MQDNTSTIDARFFFENYMAASIDAERVRRQLDTPDDTARYGAGSEHHERVSTSDNATKRQLVGYVSQNDVLERRMDRDYRLIDAAHRVLYGPNQNGTGELSTYKAGAYTDVIW